MAQSSLQAPREIFADLGAPLWEQRAHDEVERLGLRSVAPTDSDSELTIVDGKVADLVAAGLTNAEVAAQLFMAQRTVEAQLTRIYRKLDIRSRTQLSRVRQPTADLVCGNYGFPAGPDPYHHRHGRIPDCCHDESQGLEQCNAFWPRGIWPMCPKRHCSPQ
jgi:DNA-binding CsgD family transcriptional regulator